MAPNGSINEVSVELARLRAENDRLKALLREHGIPFELNSTHITNSAQQSAKARLSLEEKVELFRMLFQGRQDVFARRWYSSNTDKSGYQPVCTREWDPEFCDKKKYKCSLCPSRQFQPLGYNDLYRHLEGKDPNGNAARHQSHHCHFERRLSGGPPTTSWNRHNL